jgi:uncharacterized protein (TIGR03435 family)
VASFFPFHSTCWLNGHSFMEQELNMTGVKGAYDFTLNWSSDTAFTGSSIFTALEEQLGLRLAARKTAFKLGDRSHR